MGRHASSRRLSKGLGRADEQTVPYRAINSVTLDQPAVHKDMVVVATMAGTYRWKMKKARHFVNEFTNNSSNRSRPCRGCPRQVWVTTARS